MENRRRRYTYIPLTDKKFRPRFRDASTFEILHTCKELFCEQIWPEIHKASYYPNRVLQWSLSGDHWSTQDVNDSAYPESHWQLGYPSVSWT